MQLPKFIISSIFIIVPLALLLGNVLYPRVPLTERALAWMARGKVVDGIFVVREGFGGDGGGEGRPVVFVHGFPTSSLDWEPIWGSFGDRPRLAVDLAGFGFSWKNSSVPDETYRVMHHADVVERWIEAAGAGGREVDVVAHDLGATVMQEVLARGRVRLGRVVLLNGGIFPQQHRPLWTQWLLSRPWMRYFNQCIPSFLFSKSLHRIFGPLSKPSQAQLDEMWATIQHHNGHLLTTNHLAYMQDRLLHESRWVAALTHAPTPILFLNGPNDPISGRHVANEWDRRMQDATAERKRVFVENAGHFPQIEFPKTVAKEIKSFLDQAREE